MKLRIHGATPISSANGPGTRYALWFQGCSMEPKCPGCFNEDSWDANGGTEFDTSELINRITNNPEITGLTISGGEPLDQLEGLIELCSALNDQYEILLFTGKETIPIELTKYIDIAIAGPYKKDLPIIGSLRSSSNQEIIIYNERLDLKKYMQNDCPAEIIINEDGSMTMSGVDPIDLED